MSDTSEDVINAIQIQWDDVKFVRDYENGRDSIHTLYPFRINNFEYALPIDSHPHIRYLAHSFFQSLDEEKNDIDIETFQALCKVSDGKDYPFPKEYIIADLIVAWNISVVKFFADEIQGRNDAPFGLVVAATILGRLSATFQSSSILIKNGFNCETIYLFRAILEQTAYAYKCSETEKDEEIKKMQAPKCIPALKDVHCKVGELYGLFSNFVHHNTNIWSSFLDCNQEDGTMKVKNRSGKKSKANVIFFLTLSEICLNVICLIYDKNINPPNKDFLSFLKFLSELHDKARSELKTIYVSLDK